MNNQEREKIRRRLEQLAWLTDYSIPVPGLNTRVGIDPLLGLLPWFGDTIGAIISSYIIGQAARLGAPKAVLIKMAVNVAIDAVLGSVPLVGDLFDFAWRANQRNVRLLERYVERPRHTAAASRIFVLLLSLLLVAFILFLGLLLFALFRVVWHLVTG